jgi:hypothetical protein
MDFGGYDFLIVEGPQKVLLEVNPNEKIPKPSTDFGIFFCLYRIHQN